jgi:ADP-L-glycero-D-manno-heptose 6-epimerase
MIIVTGGAGFIGSNLVAGLNNRGFKDILLVDDLTDGRKIHNLADLEIADYLDKDDLIEYLRSSNNATFHGVFHLGACSSTTEWDGKFLMKNNYEFSKNLFHWAQDNSIPFIYASSASVYGLGENGFSEKRICENPINAYAYSKLLFDRYVFRQYRKIKSQVVGLRYFNVYGPGEYFKDNMASPAFSFYSQLKKSGTLKIFEGSHGYGDGEHERDFIHVDDCVKVNLWFFDNVQKSGIFNVGTGESASFKKIGDELIKNFGSGSISYIPFPKHLLDHYQSYTKADISALRFAGYTDEFQSITQGIKHYCSVLDMK